MPPNGPDEWRARIGNWENRKLRWYQVRCGSRLRVPLQLHLEHVISEAPLLYLLLLVEWVAAGVFEVGYGAFFTLGTSIGKARCCACVRRVRVWVAPLVSLLLSVSLLLVLAGDIEINPGPISGEGKLYASSKANIQQHDIFSFFCR